MQDTPYAPLLLLQLILLLLLLQLQGSLFTPYAFKVPQPDSLACYEPNKF